MQRIRLMILLSITLIGCDEAATFSSAQPFDVEPIPAFPQNLQASYLSSDQASVLKISDKHIIRTYDYDIKVSKDSLGNEYSLSGDTLKHTNTGTQEMVQLDGKMVIQHQHWVDTMFTIDSIHVAKPFRGYYFLNTSLNDTTWITQKMYLRKGRLTISNVAEGEDINQLKALTHSKEDTINRNFHLTRKQFKKFVRRNGFRNEEHFTRIALLW